jgi:hypothetical protein
MKIFRHILCQNINIWRWGLIIALNKSQNVHLIFFIKKEVYIAQFPLHFMQQPKWVVVIITNQNTY